MICLLDNKMINGFKEKHTKYATYKNNTKNKLLNKTLDMQHNEKIQELDKQQKMLHIKKQKLHKYNLKLEQLNKIQGIDLTQEIIEEKYQLKNKIEKLELYISSTNNFSPILDYYDKTLDIINEYHEHSTNNEQIEMVCPDDIFNKNIIKSKKSKLYDKYIKIVFNSQQKNHSKYLNIKLCPKCKIEKTLFKSDGYYICSQCGDSELIHIDIDKPNFKDINFEIRPCAYKRSNHLSEILNQFQAKESTEISKELYDKIKAELTIQRYTNYKKLNHSIIKKILKKLKLNKYYEHIYHIINNLSGLPPPNMTIEQEENIKKLFKEIQKPFSVYRPKKRKNFLNYNYIIHKICQLLNYNEFLPHFPLLKSRSNLEEQDIVWKNICNYKKYKFIPSI